MDGMLSLRIEERKRKMKPRAPVLKEAEVHVVKIVREIPKGLDQTSAEDEIG